MASNKKTSDTRKNDPLHDLYGTWSN
jgi:hypothetical protein